jgi:hypothetical protein
MKITSERLALGMLSMLSVGVFAGVGTGLMVAHIHRACYFRYLAQQQSLTAVVTA